MTHFNWDTLIVIEIVLIAIIYGPRFLNWLFSKE